MIVKTTCIGIAMLAACAAGAAAQQGAIPDASKTANPELVGDLAKGLSITPQQAEGAAGANFGAAKQGMPESDWTKVSAAVPGMDGLLKAAPMMAGAAAAAAGAMVKTGGLASATAAFSTLGLEPELVSQAIPIVTQYVTKTGGSSVVSLLSGALK